MLRGNDDAVGRGSAIRYTAVESGDYFVGVSGLNATDQGEFVITLSVTTDDTTFTGGVARRPFPAALVSRGVLEASEMLELALSGIQAGDVVSIVTSPRGDEFSSPDTLAGLFDPSGSLVASNDDGGEGYGSLLRFVAQATGDLHLSVAGVADSEFSGNHSSTGEVSITVGIVPLPEPSVSLLLGVGALGVALLFREVPCAK